MGNIGDPIKQLKGCEKGSKVQGLHNLKLYLARFGYLNYQFNPNHTNVKDDTFNDELESALKSYQIYYHLKATGILDDATVSQMARPRCGQPDKETHYRGSKSLHIVSRSWFFPNNQRWPFVQFDITYALPNEYPSIYKPPVARAFNQWASASGYFTFTEVSNFTGANLKIGFKRGSHGDGEEKYDFDGAGGVFGHAFAPTDGRLYFDAYDTFSVGPGAVYNVMDLESATLHEIGHLLGLDHNDDVNSIMNAYVPIGVETGLNADDIKGIKALYGL